MGTDLSRAQERWLVGLVLVVMIVAYAALVPHRGNVTHYDHAVYQSTVDKMHGGAGFYDAFAQASAEGGYAVGHNRAFRTPAVFLLWRVLPADHLYVAYLLLVVLATGVLTLFLTDVPLASVAVVLYLLCAGRGPGSSTPEEFLLVELWVLPLVFGALLAWRRQHWWLAAGLVGLAAITRETVALLLIGGLLAALVRRTPKAPWLVAGGAAGLLFLWHLHAASGHLSPVGADGDLVGTGHPPGSILDMMDWVLPDPSVIGLALWLAALAQLWRRRELVLLGPLFALPLTGLAVDRPYWGLTFIPLGILFTVELFARRGAAASEGSSPPRRTPLPAR